MTTRGGRQVVTSRDAGAYFCEHLLLVAQHAALGPDSSIRRGADGSPRLGFLHVPGRHDEPGSANRHACTREVVARALAGLADGLVRPRVLLTGFGSFGAVADNATGHLVSDSEALAAVRACLGGARLASHVFAVDRTAIDGGQASLQHLLRSLRPHVLLMLGVAATDDRFRVETRATPERLLLHGGPPALTDTRYERLGALEAAIRISAPSGSAVVTSPTTLAPVSPAAWSAATASAARSGDTEKSRPPEV